MPFFSVIIPVFNDEANLEAAVNSVLSQDYDDYEIIIADDASSDATGAIADDFAKAHASINALHNRTNMGVGRSRNNALDSAKGKYVIFLDSDDMLIDGALDGLEKLISQSSAPDFVVGRWKREYGSASNARLFEDPAVLKSCEPVSLIKHMNRIRYQNFVCWHYVVKRDFLDTCGLRFIDSKIAEDQEFVARLLCLAASVAYYESPMYLYNGTGRISKSMELKTYTGFVKITESLASFMKSNSSFDSEKKAFVQGRIRSVSGMLTGRLALLDESDLEKLEDFIESGIRKRHELHDVFEELELSYLLDNWKRESGIANCRSEFANGVLSMVPDRAHCKIYIFCASIDASALACIFSQNAFPFKGFIDNNPALKGMMQNGFPVYGPEMFSSESMNDLENCIVIVCHQDREAFLQISKQLQKYGLKDENIRHFKPGWA